jgi:hypothetical protein
MAMARVNRRKMIKIVCRVVGNCHRTTARARNEIRLIYFLKKLIIVNS